MSLEPGQVVHGRYRVISLLSPGGMSAIYQVVDCTLNVRCVLKEMVPYPGTDPTALSQLREQFRQEAQLLAELRHPCLPRVTDHFDEDGNAYLVMDFVQGRRLDEVLSVEGKLSEAKVLAWGRQLMEALAYCHDHGVIHRDVKPQNVVIGPSGQVTLVDFGLAKLVDPNSPHTRAVMRGLGTPEYAPPEQYDTREGHTDPRSDIYSLGATLYHALAGEPPPMLSERVVRPNSLIPLRKRRQDIRPITDRVIMKAMALRPDHRFQSIAEMYRALFGEPFPNSEQSKTDQDDAVADTAITIANSLAPSAATIVLPWIKSIHTPAFSFARIAGVMTVIVLLVAIALALRNTSPATSLMPTATVTVTVFVMRDTPPSPTPTIAQFLPSLTATMLPPPTHQPYWGLHPKDAGDFPLFRIPTRSPTPTARLVVSPPVVSPPPPTLTPIPGHRPTAAPPRPSPHPTPTFTIVPTATYTPEPSATPTPASPTPTNTPTRRPTPTREQTTGASGWSHLAPPARFQPLA